MAISETTNARVYNDAADLSELLLLAFAKANPFIEKSHNLGIPTHVQTPVEGFADGDAATSDVINMVQVAEEFRTFMDVTRIKACAMARRNPPSL